MPRFLSRFAFSREPVAYVVAAIAVLVVLRDYLTDGSFNPEAIDAAFAAVAVVLGVAARQTVYAPATVKADESAFVEVHLDDMVDAADPDGLTEDGR